VKFTKVYEFLAPALSVVNNRPRPGKISKIDKSQEHNGSSTHNMDDFFIISQ